VPAVQLAGALLEANASSLPPISVAFRALFSLRLSQIRIICFVVERRASVQEMLSQGVVTVSTKEDSLSHR
jgi:hypothetical protein